MKKNADFFSLESRSHVLISAQVSRLLWGLNPRLQTLEPGLWPLDSEQRLDFIAPFHTIGLWRFSQSRTNSGTRSCGRSSKGAWALCTRPSNRARATSLNASLSR